MSEELDAKINAFLTAKPWLKIVLQLLSLLFGAAKAKGYFAQRYGIKVGGY